MKWILWSLAGLVGVALIVVIIGWFLPVAHVASRTIRLNQPVDTVYGVVSDVGQHAAWWPDVTRVEMLDSPAGKVRFREHLTDGPLVMEVDEARPPSRFVTRIADPDQPFGGTWTYEITPDAGGTRLTITERGEVYNPIFRFVSTFVMGHTATIDSYLRALGKRFGEAVEPA